MSGALGIGDEVLGLRVDGIVGRGGMGVVLLAWDARLKRRVAVKVVAPELSADPDFRRRFVTESEVAASLEHPNVVPVYDAGEVDGRLAIVMRYVHGTDLRRLLAGEGPLSPSRALAICAQIADALGAAHEHGLVHRDVKPSNVLLDERELAYLADFGLSAQISEQRIREGRSLGTAAYAAPEQIRGDSVDGRADIYALGCVLHECLTGKPPFPRKRALGVLWAHLEDEPPRTSEHNPALSPAVDLVIAKALAKSPHERYPTGTALVEAARDALGLRQPGGRNTRGPILAGAAIALLAILAATGVLLVRADDAAKSLAPVTDSTLVRLDPTTGAVAAVVEVGRGTKAVAVGGRTVWVYNLSEGTLTAIDTRTNGIRRVSRVSTVPVESAFYNGPLLAADDGGAWVIGSRDDMGILTRARVESDFYVEHPLVLTPAAGDPVAVATGHGSVWVATRIGRQGADLVEHVLRIDPSTGSVRGRAPFPIDAVSSSGALYGLAVGAGSVWTTNAETAEFRRIEPRSGAITGRRDLGAVSAVPAAGYGSVWVVEDWGRTVLRVNPRTLAVTTVEAAGSDLVDLAVGEGAVWANGVTSGTVYRIDPDTNGVQSAIRLTSDDERAPARGAVASPSIAAGSGGVWVMVSPAE